MNKTFFIGDDITKEALAEYVEKNEQRYLCPSCHRYISQIVKTPNVSEIDSLYDHLLECGKSPHRSVSPVWICLQCGNGSPNYYTEIEMQKHFHPVECWYPDCGLELTRCVSFQHMIEFHDQLTTTVRYYKEAVFARLIIHTPLIEVLFDIIGDYLVAPSRHPKHE